MFNRKIINYLAGWKEKATRKPLILRGARQVGKTSAVLMFAEKYFKNTVYINLDKADHAKLFKEDISLDDFEKIIQIKFHQTIIPGETLVFIDEIQNSLSLIKLLRFFYEEKPELHVIAAGSLLQVRIDREGFSLPVGRVEYAYLYPLDFFEYLEAMGEGDLAGYLKEVKSNEIIPEAIHNTAINLFYEYAMVGGMPEIIKYYSQNKDINELESIYSSLSTSYSEDVYKYASSADVKYLIHIIEKLPYYAGTAITYEKFGESNYRSREMGKAFDLLEKAMLINKLQATKSVELPLMGQSKRPKKLLFLDVGLINHQIGIRGDFLEMKDLNNLYKGRISEQIVGQNILAQFMQCPLDIFYWAKEKEKGRAEVDYCLSHNNQIVGIEVKSGVTRNMKSLLSFGGVVKNAKLIRIYGGPRSREKVKYAGKSLFLESIPFYLITRMLED